VGQQWLQPSCYRVRYLLKLPLYAALCTQPRYTQANQLAHFQSPFPLWSRRQNADARQQDSGTAGKQTEPDAQV